ncbi:MULTISPECIES: hypothetical protein [unclassified Psychrobacter]|uniref:hypothetical protein n=1 Tax=unclassified Psychrobacter TaxID=196806 RepID=UPI0025B3205B|nr:MULTISPECIES: hypothetical protein [unclassified Psychrobacter]MDN3454655.1 hypothetical protein [Psychrobacter sp. APC 3350]MDN3503057.1 hypothetical protein [Psychrobacter sp. 5A.1]
MNNKLLTDKVLNESWKDKYSPSSYNPLILKENLINLINLNKDDDPNYIGDQILNSLGSNHCGTYYPIALLAVDVMITIEKNSRDNRKRKICTLGILNDLSYFELEVKDVSDLYVNKIKKEFKEKMSLYHDDNFENLL